MAGISERAPRGRRLISLSAALATTALVAAAPANAAGDSSKPVEAADICHNFGFPIGNVCVPAPSVAPTVSSQPVVTGTAREGSSIGCEPATFGRPTVSIDLPFPIPDINVPLDIVSTSTSWIKNGSPVGPVSGPRGLGTSDVGSSYACRTTAVGGVSLPFFGTFTTGSTTSTSAARTVSALPLTNTSLPTIAGTGQEGHTLTCSPGSWSPTPAAGSLSWLRNGSPVGAGSSYALTAADVGASIRCRHSVSRLGENASATSAAVTPTAKPADPVVVPPVVTPPAGGGTPPASNATPVVTTPVQGASRTGARGRAVRACNRKFKVKKGKRLSKKAKRLNKKVQQRKAVCLRKARRLPV